MVLGSYTTIPTYYPPNDKNFISFEKRERSFLDCSLEFINARLFAEAGSTILEIWIRFAVSAVALFSIHGARMIIHGWSMLNMKLTVHIYILTRAGSSFLWLEVLMPF